MGTFSRTLYLSMASMLGVACGALLGLPDDGAVGFGTPPPGDAADAPADEADLDAGLDGPDAPQDDVDDAALGDEPSNDDGPGNTCPECPPPTVCGAGALGCCVPSGAACLNASLCCTQNCGLDGTCL